MFSVTQGRAGCSHFILLQTLPKRILRLGSIGLRHLGETDYCRNGNPLMEVQNAAVDSTDQQV